jgi:lipopolysaccharide transport system permease protein
LEPATHVGTTEIVIEPARGWSPLRLRELWEYRDLFYYMTTRNLSTRYRQMALGPLWIVLQPLMSMFLYSLIFGRIAKLPSDGQPYAVFTYVALLPWTFFSDAVAAGANSLADNKNLISKVYFPRLIPAITQVVSALVDFGISFLILVVMLIVYGIRPNAGILLLPVFLVFAGLTGLAVGLWFAGIIVRYRDFGQVLGYLMRFGMYATPVVYSISLVPAEWRPLYRLNPMTGVIEGFRWALLGTGVPPDWTMIVSAIIVLAILVGALYNFKRVERNVVDVA